MSEQTRLRNAISAALTAAQRGDDGETLHYLERLAGLPDNPIEAAIWELARANVDMLRKLVGEPGDGLAVTVQVHDSSGCQVPVHDLDPPLRAAVRILLALAHGSVGDAEIQLEIVGSFGESTDIGAVLMHMLAWTVELMENCRATGTSAPTWLRRALVAGR